jgi:hypothetical protein
MVTAAGDGGTRWRSAGAPTAMFFGSWKNDLGTTRLAN